MEEIQARDLSFEAPRRWSDELNGVLWLPRMIDKARAAMGDMLGDYLYEQCPTDRRFLKAIGIDYDAFSKIVREAGDDDQRVLELLDAKHPGWSERTRSWGQHFADRHALYLFLIDLDDGYYLGPLRALRAPIRFFSSLFVHYVKYRWPSHGRLIRSEIAAERASDRAEEARGAREEPYLWYTPQNLDNMWKTLLCVVLALVIAGYIIGFIAKIEAGTLIIIAAILFAYVLYPWVRWLNRKLSLIWSILIVYAVIMGAFALAFSYLVPAAIAETQTIVMRWPTIYATIKTFVYNPHNKYLDKLPPFARTGIAHLPQHIINWV